MANYYEHGYYPPCPEGQHKRQPNGLCHPCGRQVTYDGFSLPEAERRTLKAERDALREVHTAAWEIIWTLSPHAHHTLNVESARIKLKVACEKAQDARAALGSEGTDMSGHTPRETPRPSEPPASATPGRRRYDGPPQEHDPNVRYWSIKIDMGDGEDVLDMGGTVFSEEQAREQIAHWLRSFADRVEKTGRP